MLTTAQEQAALSKNFADALKESGAAPKLIAEKCEVSEQAVSNWKRTGKIARRYLPKIAELTGWSVAKLLTGTDAVQPKPPALSVNASEPVTSWEREILEDLRVLIDEDREEIHALVREKARKARAYLDRSTAADGKRPTSAKSAAKQAAPTPSRAEEVHR